MKFNKWTIGLAALGVVSLPSAATAEEAMANSVMTALSSTTLSGYLDTSVQWNFGSGNANTPRYKFGGPGKADGFNLNVVQLRIDRPLDEMDWAAGYRVDLWAGPDANVLGTQSVFGSTPDFAVRQAYIALRAPVLGNGINFKLGVFDSIVGYESVESPNNPNYTRSYGHSIEPQTHTGLLASYQFNEMISASVGIANTVNSAINSRAQGGSAGVFSGLFGAVPATNAIALPGQNDYAESYKAYMASVALTAPENMGDFAGSMLYAGVVNGYNNSVFGSGAGMPQFNAYVGATLATPVTGLRLGAAWDWMDVDSRFLGTPVELSIWSIAGYATFQATEKLSAHARLEYVDASLEQPFNADASIFAATATAQYDLWENVISRLELRWDHATSGGHLFGGSTPGIPTAKNAWMLAANLIYKF
jgi:hypothetical protein